MRSRALCTLTAIAASIACERPGETPAAAAPGAAGASATITYAIPHDSTLGAAGAHPRQPPPERGQRAGLHQLPP